MSADGVSDRTIYIVNDNCPDYTWGLTEEQTRQAFADIMAAHLDEMVRTDGEAEENRDRYTMAVTQEALCFMERFPERTEELIGRIKDGRVCVSPYLCNTLWGFQGVEAGLRSFYPARRLEREYGVPIDIAEHIEEPSLPWGVASILAGCGIRWLSCPFYAYDSTFGQLDNPPVFIHEGPDGRRIRVVMDPWLCNRAAYTQGARLLDDPDAEVPEILGHYREMGDAYPLPVILASGTHGDIDPKSGEQAAQFARAIRQYNRSPVRKAKLINATLRQFCEAVDSAEEEQPFLQVVRGCFGHSWDLWPVSLAKHAADMPQNERDFMAAETFVAVASGRQPDLVESTQAERERAEWCLAMLGDHAWNGTDQANKKHNADLRKAWNDELREISRGLVRNSWSVVSLKPATGTMTLFNSLSVRRAGLVVIDSPNRVEGTSLSIGARPAQLVEDGDRRLLHFVSPLLPGFGLQALEVESDSSEPDCPTRATTTRLESPYYSIDIDQSTGGVRHLTHKATGVDLVVGGSRLSLGQTVYFDGEEHVADAVDTRVVAQGPVLARVSGTTRIKNIAAETRITVYSELDRVDFEVRITKPPSQVEERLCHVFPVMGDDGRLRIETPGAVIVPRPRPSGDLLPGADTTRFAVQGFVDVERPDVGLTIAPIDSFALRLDLASLTFESLGNDQNFREVAQDQGGVTTFRFRYSVRAYVGRYSQADSVAWSRAVATPIVAAWGHAEASAGGIRVDPARAIATCLKPADDGRGDVLRLWETAGESSPLPIGLPAYRRAVLTDLLERDLEELTIIDEKVAVPVRPFGFAGLRLLR